LPKAIAVLDPKRKDCPYPFKELSGCGVGFKFIQAFSEIHTSLPVKPDELLDLVAVSIASDIVDITGENRVLAFYGLRRLAESPRPGLAALMDIARIPGADISIMRIVFGMAPRINAAGRLEDAAYAVKLMLADNAAVASELAGMLDNHNKERRELDRTTTEEAIQMIEKDFSDTYSTVLFNKHWHKGIIGIVASRCIETYYRPTIILTATKNGLLAGSARSVDGFDLYHALEQCSDYLVQFGGHKYAAGMTLQVDRLQDFRDRFESVVSSQITEEQKDASIEVDAKLNLDDITPKFYRILSQMAPFGPGNTEPVFMATGLSAKNIKRLPSKKNPEVPHLKLQCVQGSSVFDCIGFDLGKFESKLTPDCRFSMIFVITENEFRGRRSLQLQIKDIKLE
jgi:single-stranded-DNA-specific exonuclease